MRSSRYPTLPNSNEIEVLVWDWDGTLVDSGEINFQALRQAMLEHGLVLDPDWYAQHASMATRELLAVWQKEYGPLLVGVKTITSFCRDYVIAHAPDLQILPETAALARCAHEAGWRQAIASNASTATLAAALQATSMVELFAVTVTSSDVSRAKPAPDAFLLAAERLGVEPEKCLVYEDSPQGIIGARAAGMRVVDVREQLMLPSRLAGRCP